MLQQPLIWLYDEALEPQATIREYRSVLVQTKLYDVSELHVVTSAANLLILQAYPFLTFGDSDELYVLDNVKVNRTGNRYEVTAIAISAITELNHRVIEGRFVRTGKSGAFARDVIQSMTGSRAILLTAGNLATYGTTTTRTRGWGDTAYDAVRDPLIADSIGLRVRLGAGTAVVDAVVPAPVEYELGDALRNVSKSEYRISERSWRNYAYVEGTDGVRVEVDQTSGAPRRELFVDGSFVERGDMTLEEYEDSLASIGAARLRDTRRVEFVDAETEVPLSVGNVSWYDGIVWSGWMLCNETTLSIENGVQVQGAKLGEPSPTIATMIRSGLWR